MVGLGETDEEIIQVMQDLKSHDVDMVTIGQYLQATKRHLRVKRFISPEQFQAYEQYGKKIGIKHMYCGPFVRSSYNASLFV